MNTIIFKISYDTDNKEHIELIDCTQNYYNNKVFQIYNEPGLSGQHEYDFYFEGMKELLTFHKSTDIKDYLELFYMFVGIFGIYEKGVVDIDRKNKIISVIYQISGKDKLKIKFLAEIKKLSNKIFINDTSKVTVSNLDEGQDLVSTSIIPVSKINRSFYI